MPELYINKKAVWTESTVDDPEALAKLKACFPGRSARRMTRLGMQLYHVLREMEVGEACSLVYATSYSETCTIEKFLESFPYPSPLAFQTSIHPGGVEQFLIQNKQAITEFFPLAGKANLLFRALETASLCAGETVVLCGGEERGTWLLETGLSSDTNYAWALETQRTRSGATIGRIAWSGLSEAEGDALVLPAFVEALQLQSTYHYRAEEGGEMELSWYD